jgi:hypothetical protein
VWTRLVVAPPISSGIFLTRNQSSRLHLGGDVLHFLEARRDQARQADDVGAFDACLGQDVLARHHDAHVDDFEVVALEHDGDDVLADVVHIALHGRDDDLALGPRFATGVDQRPFFGLDVRQQVRHRLLHHACALHHLRQEHLAGAEQLAHLVHAGHQRAFDHVQRAAALRRDLLPADLGVGHDELVDAVHQRVSQPLLDGGCTPCQLDALVLGRALHALGHLEQPFGGVGAAVQHHVFDAFAQFSIELVVDADHPGVDDAHVHAGLDGVVQEHRVDRLAHRLVAAEAEAHVADAAGHLGPRRCRLIQRVASMKSTA